MSSVQLETAATAGVIVVLAVIGIVMYEAISAGLPGLASGDVPIWSLKVRIEWGLLAQHSRTLQIGPSCPCPNLPHSTRCYAHGQWVLHIGGCPPQRIQIFPPPQLQGTAVIRASVCTLLQTPP